MSFRISCGIVPAAVALGLCCAAVQLRAGDSTPPSPQDEAPGKKSVASAVEQLESSRPARSDILKRMPRKPETIESLFGERGSMPAPLQAIVPGRRSRNLLDQEEDWAFITPEDVIHEYVMKEILKMPRYGRDGRDMSRVSAFQRYFEQLPRGGAEKPTFETDWFGLFGGQKPVEDQKRPGESTASSGLLAMFDQRPALMNESADPFARADSARPDMPLDFLNSTVNRELTPEALRERKIQEDQMIALRKIWDFQQTAVPTPTWSPPGQFPGPGLTGGSPGTSPSVVGSSPFAVAQPLPFNPFAPGAAPAIPAFPVHPKAPGVPGQLDASQASPDVNSSRTPPPKAEFSVPQRRF